MDLPASSNLSHCSIYQRPTYPLSSLVAYHIARLDSQASWADSPFPNLGMLLPISEPRRVILEHLLEIDRMRPVDIHRGKLANVLVAVGALLVMQTL